MRLALVPFILLGCSALQVPGGPSCRSAPVADGIVATASHCRTEGRQLARDVSADLKLVATPTAKPWRLAEPAPGVAQVRDYDFELSPVVTEDGREFFSLFPPVEPGWSGAAVTQDGALVGIVIGNDHEKSWAVSSREVRRLLKLTRQHE